MLCNDVLKLKSLAFHQVQKQTNKFIFNKFFDKFQPHCKLRKTCLHIMDI